MDVQTAHMILRNTTMAALEDLRVKVQDNRIKLSEAEKLLAAEEDARKTFVQVLLHAYVRMYIHTYVYMYMHILISCVLCTYMYTKEVA